MGLRSSLISFMVSCFVMAVFWQIIDMGVNIGLAGNFLGKVVLSEILSKALGGR